MKLRCLVPTVVLSGICTSAYADLSFTLITDILLGDQKSGGKSTTYHKDGRFRYDHSPTETTIIDTKENKITIIDRSSKTYVASDWKPVPKKSLPFPVSIIPTDRRTTIAGQPARLYLMKAKPNEETKLSAELWCAENIARVDPPQSEGRGYFSDQLFQQAKGQMLRFRVKILVNDELRADLSWNISALSTKQLPNSYFEVPADYSPGAQKVDALPKGDL